MKQLGWIAHASETVRNSNPHIFGGKGRKKRVQGNVERATPYSKKMLMNKTESEFAQRLEIMKLNGEILRYVYQGITLRWGVDEKTGDSMRYTPDFIVFEQTDSTMRNGHDFITRIRLIEVKGPHIHYRQQAVARFKGCRAWWPEFQFEMWQKQKTAWKQIL